VKSEGLSSREGASWSFGVAAGQSNESVQRAETALELIYVCDEGAGGNIFWVGGVVIGMIECSRVFGCAPNTKIWPIELSRGGDLQLHCHTRLALISESGADRNIFRLLDYR